MGRNPFEVESGCYGASFDVNNQCTWVSLPYPQEDRASCTLEHFTQPDYIPDLLPFCSIPDFTSPTFVARDPEVIVPDIVLPDIFNCITGRRVSYTPVVVSAGTLPRPQFADKLTMHLNAATMDCGSPELEFDLAIPCLPLSVNASGKITLTTHNSVSFNAAMVSDDSRSCRLSMNLVFNLDSSGFDFTYNKAFGVTVQCNTCTVKAGSVGGSGWSYEIPDTVKALGGGVPLYVSVRHTLGTTTARLAGPIEISTSRLYSTTTEMVRTLAVLDYDGGTGCWSLGKTLFDGDIYLDSPLM